MAAQVSDGELGRMIGRAIAKYRQGAGLTQAQVAEVLNISNDAVSRMERGAIMPSAARLIQLAGIFGCDAADLLTEGSPHVADQSRQVAMLLVGLDEAERVHLLRIIEDMVAWYRQARKG